MVTPIKKKWYKIIAPAIFNEQEIGETFVADASKTIGRTVNANLMVLTNDPKKQNINVGFRISGVDGEKLKTEIFSYNMMPSSLKRFIRRSRDRIDDSFICTTSDNKSIIIKPFLVTRFKTNRPVISALRLNTRKFLKDFVSKSTFDNLINDILSHKVQSQLKGHLKKIYELRTCEIRSMEQKGVGAKIEKVEIKEELKKVEEKGMKEKEKPKEIKEKETEKSNEIKEEKESKPKEEKGEEKEVKETSKEKENKKIIIKKLKI